MMSFTGGRILFRYRLGINKLKIVLELKKYMTKINYAAGEVEEALKADYFSDEKAVSLLEELDRRLKNIQLRSEQLKDNLLYKSNISAALFDIMEREYEDCRHIYDELKNMNEPYCVLVCRLADSFRENDQLSGCAPLTPELLEQLQVRTDER